MIVLGYIGQFYETSNLTLLWVYGLLSTVFFLHVLYLIYQVISSSYGYLSSEGRSTMSGIWWLFFVSWWLYPVAYIMPVISYGPWGVVAR